jgi:hypothetical protein
MIVKEFVADLSYMQAVYKKCLATCEELSEVPPQVLVGLAACHGQLGANTEAQRCLQEAINSGAGRFDPQCFATLQIAICARQREADLWRSGFRKVGLEV